MQDVRPQPVKRCPLHVGRRKFLCSLGASAMAFKVGVLDFASELLGGEAPAPPRPTKPIVHALFFRPKTDKYWMGWPGAAYPIKTSQELYTKTLREAADKLGVDLKVHDEPFVNKAAAETFLGQIKDAPPDGLILTCMSLNSGWQGINFLAANKGDVPTIVFSPVGSSFTGHLGGTRNLPKVFCAATQDVSWLSFGVRMLKTVWDMKTSRICVCAGGQTVERKLEPLGLTLQYIPNARFPEEFKKMEASDEVKAVADFFTKEAKNIVEPKKQDILNAAKYYFVARKLMTEAKCHGYSMDCLGLVGGRVIPGPPCMAMLRLNDEGSVGGCEADWNAAISLRLAALLFGRPGFMQDPCPNTINNTLIGAHCSCPTKLDGCDKPGHEPVILRSHSESDIGVSPQVLWRIGEKATVMKFQGPGGIILGTGKVVSNVDTPPSGGCRTSVELELDGVADSRDSKGFHQLFIYGDLERPFKAYCQLAGINVAHI
ncbi:MAG TPA: hypothetical protein VNE39_21260 [Planctomycetota bacterium]|nr:hypothetical protein [Planctomycetota bacterium]